MRHLKTVLIIALILSAIVNTAAQNDLASYPIDPNRPLTSKKILKDTALWEVVYYHITKDPFLNEKKVDYEMLTVGNRYSLYGGYGDYQLDSILSIDSVRKTIKVHGDYRKLSDEFEPITIHMLTNYVDSTVNYYGKVFINYYRYSEPIPEIDWTLHEEDETLDVMGYECRKATATWRGREWTAWYSDIPLSSGPWKFNGLPGLILRLEDSKGEHVFEAMATKDDVFPFGYKDKLYCKTTREKYEESLTDYKHHAGRVAADMGMVQMTDEERKKYENRRLFHNPIELE